MNGWFPMFGRLTFPTQCRTNPKLVQPARSLIVDEWTSSANGNGRQRVCYCLICGAGFAASQLRCGHTDMNVEAQPSTLYYCHQMTRSLQNDL